MPNPNAVVSTVISFDPPLDRPPICVHQRRMLLVAN
jgi:hypothetical protein